MNNKRIAVSVTAGIVSLLVGVAGSQMIFGDPNWSTIVPVAAVVGVVVYLAIPKQ